MNVLYLSYDGALDPLGRSQVVPYLEKLTRLGHRFDLVTFEKSTRWAQAEDRLAMADRLLSVGIAWHPLRYHKRVSPVATTFDLVAGTRLCRRLLPESEVQLVHARSYPSALVARRLWRQSGVPYLFDMRGLYAEERTEGGIWPEGGALYRATKRLERGFLRDAAAVVTLTHASLDTIQAMVGEAGGRAPVEVIPTSVDLDHFRPAPAPSGPFTLSYVGSVGTWYLLDEMLNFARALLAEVSGSRLRFVVNLDPEAVRGAARRAGLPDDRVEVRTVTHDRVPQALAGSWATFAFIRPASSKMASAATKVSESLALGLPVVVNRGVGDAADIVEAHGIGMVVDPFAPETFPQAIGRLRELAGDASTRERCRQVAERLFDITRAAECYDRLYQGMRGPSGARSPVGR